jgi:hypothetical protein
MKKKEIVVNPFLLKQRKTENWKVKRNEEQIEAPQISIFIN